MIFLSGNENKEELIEKFENLQKQYLEIVEKNKELQQKIHKELDKNAITRAYQLIIDDYFKELLEEK